MALIVTNTGTVPFRWVEWGQEGALTYNNTTSLILDSDSLVTSGFAGTGSTRTGAYDPGAAGNSVITCALNGNPTAVCGTGVQSHVGAFRVRARVWTASAVMQVRLSWRVAGGTYSINNWAEPAVTGYFASVDLGVIIIPRVLAGTQAWDGRIEAYTTDGSTASVDVDLVALMPQADGYGKARATYGYTPGVAIGADAFTGTTAGNALNARVAPSGGTWATSGSATDFVFADDLGGEQVKRTAAVAGAGPRFGLLGTTTYTDVELGVTIVATGLASSVAYLGTVARWVDANNYLSATCSANSGSPQLLVLQAIVAGADGGTVLSPVAAPASGTYRLRAVVFASGWAVAQLVSAGSILGQVTLATPALATGGTLATGKAGIFDNYAGAGGSPTRYFDDFQIATPAAEPVVAYASRKLFVRSDDVIREDSTGVYTARPPSYRGSRITFPPGTGRVAVLAHRNDLETAPWEPAVESFTTQVGWTPRGLAVPRA